MSRLRFRAIDGLLLLDKPSGMTSNAALQTARRIVMAKKAGHTGTLDPLASGLLPLCFGEATKFSSELLHAEKSYLADIHLGVTTDTADAEGHVLETRPVSVSEAKIEAALVPLRGDILQTPPMYSALKRDGKPLYAYARAGITLDLPPRPVKILELRLLDYADALLPLLRIHVRCSHGAYIRSLAADIGAALGCGAHLCGLRRLSIGRFDLAQALTLPQLAQAVEMLPAMQNAVQRAETLSPPLLAVDTLLGALDSRILDSMQAQRLQQGQAVMAADCVGNAGTRLRIYDKTGKFLGVAVSDGTGVLHPKRLLTQTTES